jgi:hypothetical protein
MPELNHYFNRFEEVFDLKVHHVSGLYADNFDKYDVSKATVGLCIKYGLSPLPNEVRVLKSWWDDSSDLEKELLVYHELGHCVINRKHKEGFIDGTNCPNSLMNSIMVGEYCYIKHYDYYIWELKNGK